MCVYKLLCRHMFSLPLDIYLGVELLGYVAGLFLTFCRMARLFSSVALKFIDDVILMFN